MAVRNILRMGDARLLEPARPVTDFADPALQALLADMFDTMAAAGGVGLAAPQIGVGLRVVIFGFERSERYPEARPVPRTVLINPVVTPLAAGAAIDRSVDGFHARVVQHECDHLAGKLFPMRVRDFARFGFTAALFPDLPNPEPD